LRRHHLTKVLPYAADDLFRMVGDIERYPDFLPWLTSLRTWNARQLGEGVDTIDAEAAVGFAMVRERFSTRVRRDAGERRIDVGLLSGPFKALRNSWRFTPEGQGTRIDFDIDFAFRSKTLSVLLSNNLEHAVERIVGCFEDRAKALYGAGAQVQPA
jgi:coenzyme Q-binding protein COQ10